MLLKELLINAKKWLLIPRTTYIVEEERNGLIQNICRTHDYIVIAILVRSKGLILFRELLRNCTIF